MIFWVSGNLARVQKIGEVICDRAIAGLEPALIKWVVGKLNGMMC